MKIHLILVQSEFVSDGRGGRGRSSTYGEDSNYFYYDEDSSESDDYGKKQMSNFSDFLPGFFRFRKKPIRQKTHPKFDSKKTPRRKNHPKLERKNPRERNQGKKSHGNKPPLDYQRDVMNQFKLN